MASTKVNRRKNNRFNIFEVLEPRRLLSTSIWTGAAGNHLFSDAGNWQGNVAPASGDDIQFNDLGTPQTVDVDAASTVGNIFISGNYTLSDHTLTLAGDVIVSDAARATFNDTVAITVNSHFTTGTGAVLQLGTLSDTSSNVLDKYGAGDLVFAGDSHATWNLLENGTITLAANTHIDLTVYGGKLDGSGAADSISDNAGVISPVSSTGPSTITGTNNAYIGGGSLNVTLNNSTSASALANPTGTFTLANSPDLNVSLGNNFPTAAGTVYTIVNNTSGHAISGTFANLAEGATLDAGGERFAISYVGGTGDDITLTTAGATPGLPQPTVGLNAASTNTTVGTADLLTATVAGSASTPTGTVTFSEGSTTLGTGTLNGSGVATFSVNSFAAGIHVITATYGGNSSYAAATSSTISVTSTGPVNPTGPTVTAAASAAVLTAKATSLSVSATDTTTPLSNGLTYTWSIVKMPSGAKVPVFSANGTHAAAQTTAALSKDGTYHFRVTVRDTNGQTTTSDVDYVAKQKARGLRLTPHGQKIKAGSRLQLKSVALDQFQHPMRVLATPTYALLSGSGSISSGGLFTAGKKKGSATVEVTLNSLVGTIGVTVV